MFIIFYEILPKFFLHQVTLPLLEFVTLKMKIDICVRVHFKFFTISCRWSWTLSLNSECKIDKADFADRMFFLPSNLTEEISPERKHLTRGMAEKKKTSQT